MMGSDVIISARGRFRRSTPLLVLTDLQREHVTPGRPYAVENPERAIEACTRLLEAAREERVAIAHFRRLEADLFFNEHDVHSEWVEAVRPRPGEMVFAHELPSCYASEAFERFIGHVRAPSLIMAGFGAEHTGIATAIDAAKRGHDIWFVSDASASCPHGGSVSHLAVCAIVGQYAGLFTTEEALREIKRAERRAATS